MGNGWVGPYNHAYVQLSFLSLRFFGFFELPVFHKNHTYLYLQKNQLSVFLGGKVTLIPGDCFIRCVPPKELKPPLLARYTMKTSNMFQPWRQQGRPPQTGD